MTEQLYKKIFDFAIDVVLAEGGDGDFIIVCANHFLFYKTVDAFREWKLQYPDWIEDYSHDNIYSYSDNQQSITIVEKSYEYLEDMWALYKLYI